MSIVQGGVDTTGIKSILGTVTANMDGVNVKVKCKTNAQTLAFKIVELEKIHVLYLLLHVS